MFCKHCGVKLDEEATVCGICGKKVEEEQTIKVEVTRPEVKGGKVRNKYVTALLAFFFGSLGVHKFYEAKIGCGILYLLFCWTGLPALASIIDIIVVLCKETDYIV